MPTSLAGKRSRRVICAAAQHRVDPRERQSGVTLIEMVVVVTIVGLIAATRMIETRNLRLEEISR